MIIIGDKLKYINFVVDKIEDYFMGNDVDFNNIKHHISQIELEYNDTQNDIEINFSFNNIEIDEEVFNVLFNSMGEKLEKYLLSYINNFYVKIWLKEYNLYVKF